MEPASPGDTSLHSAQSCLVANKLCDKDALFRCGDNKCLELILDLEIFQKDSKKTGNAPPNKITVTVEAKPLPHAPPVLTLFEGDSSIKSNSIFQTTFSDIKSISGLSQCTSGELDAAIPCANSPSSRTISKHSKSRKDLIRFPVLKEICYYTNENKTSIMSSSKRVPENGKNPSKIDKATLIITNSSSEDSVCPSSIINDLTRRIDDLEQKLKRQEIAFKNIDQTSVQSDSTNPIMTPSEPTHHSSFIGQYSHVPETSGFQPNPSSPSSSNRRTLNKEHNSEQYGREFTTYDGITDTRQRRRESASMPLSRANAAEMPHGLKARNKHAIVRDYRLMDCVHYLAQGEFAPRNDGIKLTPSREAVLSDIIWEDVCRSHWPSARLTRRGNTGKMERLTYRSDLQRQIDSLLRDRITNIERRRRRHYRVMKMNQGNSSGKTIGKTGDVIVANNKHPSKYKNDDTQKATCSKGSSSARPASRRTPEDSERATSRRTPRAVPGMSVEFPRKSHHELKTEQAKSPRRRERSGNRDVPETSAGSEADSRPRLVVGKREPIRRKGIKDLHSSKEHYILLPTLVVKTSSNFHKQKYNQLYRAIKLEKEPNTTIDPDSPGPSDESKSKKRSQSKKKIYKEDI